MRLGWCIDGDNPTYYDKPSNMELHETCRTGQSDGKGITLDCDCWCHIEGGTFAKYAPKTVKRNGRGTAKKAETKVVKSKAGKNGYSKNGKKLGRPKGSKNKKKAVMV